MAYFSDNSRETARKRFAHKTQYCLKTSQIPNSAHYPHSARRSVCEGSASGRFKKDTSFMTPYVPRDTTNTDPIDTGNVHITLVEGGNAFVAYPNPFRQSVKIKVESGELKVENGVATAWLTDLSGRREEVHLIPSGERKTESGERVYSLDLTSRPQATYLLTLTTADGKQHTVKLLKQSDIFAR